MDRQAKAELAKGGADDAGDLLSYDEARAACEALSEDELLKLERGARQLAGGTGYEPLELLHEAIARTLAGKRNCRKGTNFIAFLFMVMKGIVSHDRKQRNRLEQIGDDDEMSAAESGVSGGPEEELLRKAEDAAFERLYDRVLAALDGDDDALLAIAGLEEGLKGAKLRESLGVTQAQYTYTMRRIRRKVEMMRPKEWRR